MSYARCGIKGMRFMNTNVRNILIALVIASCALTIVSCKPATQSSSDLLGTWEFSNVSDSGTSYFEQWILREDSTFSLNQEANDNKGTFHMRSHGAGKFRVQDGQVHLTFDKRKREFLDAKGAVQKIVEPKDKVLTYYFRVSDDKLSIWTDRTPEKSVMTRAE